MVIDDPSKHFIANINTSANSTDNQLIEPRVRQYISAEVGRASSTQAHLVRVMENDFMLFFLWCVALRRIKSAEDSPLGYALVKQGGRETL